MNENQYVKITCLKENSLTPTLYSIDRDLEQLVKSIETYGILEPLVVRSISNTSTQFIVLSGIRRLRASTIIGLKELPVIIKPYSNDEVNEGLIISYNLQRIKLNSELVREIKFIKEWFNVKQGSRSTKSSKGSELLKKLNQKYNKTRIDKLGRVGKLIDIISDGDDEVKQKEYDKLDRGSISSTLNRLRKEVAEKENRKKIKSINSFSTPDVNIYQQDMSNLSQLTDESVQTIVTSPPYFNMRNYNNGSNLIDTETNLDQFVNQLAEMFDDCKRVLKFRGSMFVNISDKIDKGEYQLVAFGFASEMKKKGWILADTITWIKNNAQYTSGKGSNTMHEYILHFVKTPQYFYDSEWLNKEGVLPKEFIYGVGKKQPKLRSVIDYRHPTITTNTVNNHSLKKECEFYGISLTHSATYPVEIPLIGIMSTSKPDDIVLDPFCGSGTSGQAAISNGRKFVGYELNSTYIEISKVRLGLYKGQKIAA